MSETDTPPDDIQDFLQPGAPSRDLEYLAWREARIKQALEADLAAPEQAVPQHVIWKNFGIEY